MQVSLFLIPPCQGTISDVNVDCRLSTSSEAYDKASGELVMRFEIEKFKADATCKDVIDLRLLGYLPSTIARPANR